MSYYPKFSVDVTVLLDPNGSNHINIGGLIGDKYDTLAPIVLEMVESPNFDHWYKAYPAQNVDIAPNSENEEISSQSSLERAVNTGESPNISQTLMDADHTAETSSFAGGHDKSFKNSTGPDELLDRAATHSTQALAVESGVTTRTVDRWILTAVKAVAERDGHTNDEVIFQLQRHRRENGVSRNVRTNRGTTKVRKPSGKRAMTEKRPRATSHKSKISLEKAPSGTASDVVDETSDIEDSIGET